MDTTNVKELALRSIAIMADGDRDDFDAVYHPEFLNHEARDEPPATRVRGPEGVWATALWLRGAFADLDWEIHDVVVEGSLAAVHCTMSGRQTGPFVGYDEHARVKDVFPPRGRRFATTQTHWLRVADGQVVEHWANRDDLGMAFQCGWVPPSPAYLMRAALAKRRARRAEGDSAPAARLASVAGAVLALVLALAFAADSMAADRHWSVSSDTARSATALGLDRDAGATARARAAVRRDAGLSRRQLGTLARVPEPGPRGSLRLRQTVGGLRVLWSQLNVGLQPGGIAGFTGTVVPLPGGELRGRVAVSPRRAKALAARHADGRAHTAELVAYAGEPAAPRAPRRAYVVQVADGSDGGDSPSPLCVIVDAATGKVLGTWRGTAAVPAAAPRAGASAATFLAQYADAKGGSSTALPFDGFDLKTNGDPYRYDSDGGGFFASFGKPTPLAQIRQAADVSTEVIRFFCQRRLYCDRNGGPAGQTFFRHFFTINWTGTSSYDSLQERMYLAREDAHDWQVAAHELGHSMDHHLRDEFLETFEGREVKEGLAEIFAFDFSRDRGAPDPDAVDLTKVMADPRNNILVPLHPGGSTVKGPGTYPEYYCNTTNEDLNGYILGHAYFRMTETIGHNTVGRMLQSVPFHLPARREFGDVRAAFELVARIQFPGPNGQTGTVENKVSAAFKAVGITVNSRRTDRCKGASA